MPDTLPPSIRCPVLIGRDAQVAALTCLLDQARAGHGQMTRCSVSCTLFIGSMKRAFR